MKNTQLLSKEKKIETDSSCYFNGNIDNVIRYLKDKKAEYKKLGYVEIRVELEDVWGYYDEHYIEIVYYGRKDLNVKE